jgi:hypothetical protein
MNSFFVEKMKAVMKAYFSLNNLGFYPGGVSAFIQAKIYKCMCLSLLLYGIEIFIISKTTLKQLDLIQNGILRYMTGLSKHCHISPVRKNLKLFNIIDLNLYMKLTFIKNIKNSSICNKIFLFKLNSNASYKPRSKCFIKEYLEICKYLEKDPVAVYESTMSILAEFKEHTFGANEEDLTESEIRTCLVRGNLDARIAMNSILYAGNNSL